jgi:hypothetical protein
MRGRDDASLRSLEALASDRLEFAVCTTRKSSSGSRRRISISSRKIVPRRQGEPSASRLVRAGERRVHGRTTRLNKVLGKAAQLTARNSSLAADEWA